jgi:ELWxxDGT repeat protein
MKKVAIYLILTISTINICFSQMSMVKDINYQTKHSAQLILANVGNDIFFTAQWVDSTTLETKRALWRTDGTEANTKIIMDKNLPGTFFSYEYADVKRTNKRFVGADSVMFYATKRDTLIRSNGGTYSYSIATLNKVNKSLNQIKKIVDFKPTGTTYVYSDYDGIDVNESDLFNFNRSGNFVYFVSKDSPYNSNSSEFGLFRTDGTSSGTFRLKEGGINGRILRNPIRLTVKNDLLYFIANGKQVLKTQGTDSTTTTLIDFESLGDTLTPYKITLTNDKIFINVKSYSKNYIYILNNNHLTINILSTLNSSYNYSQNDDEKNNDIMYFLTSQSNTYQIIRSDGTATGTYPVFSTTSNVSNLKVHKNILFFVTRIPSPPGTNNGDDFELWRSDGSLSGTYLLRDINQEQNTNVRGSNIQGLTSIGNNLFFFANDGVNGLELWKTDGSTNGTVMVKNADPFPPNPRTYGFGGDKIIQTMQLNNSLVYFFSTALYGEEIWVSDGTSIGTKILKDINQATESSFNLYPFYSNERIDGFDDRILLNVNDGFVGQETWQSNGTKNGTELLIDYTKVWSHPTYLLPLYPAFWNSRLIPITKYNGKIYFKGGRDVYGQGNSLLSVDIASKTESSSIVIPHGMESILQLNTKGFVNPGFNYTYPIYYYDFNSNSFTTLKTFELSTVNARGLSNPFGHTNFQNKIYCIGYDDIYPTGKKEIWETDGTIANTKKVTFPQLTSDISKIYVNKDKMYIIEDISFTLGKLWYWEGGSSQPIFLRNIDLDYYKTAFVSKNDDYVYLIGKNSIYQISYNLNTANIIFNLPNSSYFFNNKTSDFYRKAPCPNSFLFFLEKRLTSTTINELWSFNALTNQVQYINDIAQCIEATFNDVQIVNNKFYFVNYTAQDGCQIWRSDGTKEGTFMVGPISSKFKNSKPQYLVNLNNELYFSADDGFHGRELWKYNPCEVRETVASGNWENSSNWTCSEIPKVTDFKIFVNEGHIININSNTEVRDLINRGTVKFMGNYQLKINK